MIVMSVPNNYMYEIQIKINKKKVIGCIFTQRKGIYSYYEKPFLYFRIDRNYLFGSFEITSIRLYTFTSLRNPQTFFVKMLKNIFIFPK